MLWEQELMSVTMTSRDITYFLGSRNFRKWFKHLVRVNCEYICPDPAWASICSQRYFRTNPSLQNVLLHDGGLSKQCPLSNLLNYLYSNKKKKIGTIEEAKHFLKYKECNRNLRLYLPSLPHACCLHILALSLLTCTVVCKCLFYLLFFFG